MQENNVQEAKNLTQGNVLSTLLKFAVPVLLAMFLQALYGGVDLLVVGQFETTQDVSGVSTGSMLLHTLTLSVRTLLATHEQHNIMTFSKIPNIGNAVGNLSAYCVGITKRSA